MPNITLTGYKLVQSLDAFVPCGAKPGTFVCTVIPNPGEFQYDVATRALYIDGGFGGLTFPNLTLKKNPARHLNRLRLVLEDERAKFRTVNVSSCWNPTTPSGSTVERFETDLQFIWDKIAESTGMTIDSSQLNANVFFRPSLKHKTLDTFVSELLYYSASRLTWDAVGGRWVVRHANNFEQLNYSNAMRKALWSNIPSAIILRTAPTIYQSDLDVQAGVLNSDDDLVSFADAGINVSDYFNGFGGDMRHQNSAFRVWEVTGGSQGDLGDTRTIPCRYETVAVGCPPIAMEPFFHGAIASFDHFPSPSGQLVRSYANVVTNGGRIVAADRPVLPISGGSLQQTCKLRIAYNLTEGAGLARKQKTYQVPGGQEAGEHFVDIPQITPFVVDHPNTNIVANNWITQADSIGQLHANRMGINRQQTELLTIADVSKASHVSAVRYRMHLFPTTEVRMHVVSSPEIPTSFEIY